MHDPICYLTVRTDAAGLTIRELTQRFTWDEVFAVWAQVTNDPVEPLYVCESQVVHIRPATQVH
jgi:hypothetical protein